MKKIILAFSLLASAMANEVQIPAQFRVSLQYIEVSHSDLTELLADGEPNTSSLYEKTIKLSKTNQAKIIDTNILLCMEKKSSKLEAVQEKIFPMEYGEKQIPHGVGMNWKDEYDLLTPYYFATRHVGASLQVDSKMLKMDTKPLINFVISADLVSLLRHETMKEHKDEFGDASIRMPIFESCVTQTEITIQPGKFQLINVISPKSKDPAAESAKKVMLFVRADLVPPLLASPSSGKK